MKKKSYKQKLDEKNKLILEKEKRKLEKSIKQDLMEKIKSNNFELSRNLINIGKKEKIIRFFKKAIGKKYITVCMLLTNGNYAWFSAEINGSSFSFADRTYIIDFELKQYNESLRQYYLFYHQEISMPIKLDFPVNEIITEMENPENCEVDMAVNPVNLRRFVESDFIQKVMQGADMTDSLQFLKTFLIINTIVLALIFVIIIRDLI